MIAALVILPLAGVALGLIGVCAAVRAGQCSRRLEESAYRAAPAPPEELRRAA